LEQLSEAAVTRTVWHAGKKQPPIRLQAAGEDKTLIDRTDSCSQWPEEESPCPVNVRVERGVSGIVIALSAESQLLALLDIGGTDADALAEIDPSDVWLWGPLIEDFSKALQNIGCTRRSSRWL
jgi:hypothetical protein